MIPINLSHFLIDQFCLPLGSDKLFAKILLWSPELLVILPALPCFFPFKYRPCEGVFVRTCV